MAKPKTPDKRNLRGSQGPALAAIPVDAAITLVIGNSGGKSPPLPPPEQNQTRITERGTVRVAPRALTAPTLLISNETVPSQHTKALGTTKTSTDLGSSLLTFAPSHRGGTSLADQMGVLLHTHLTAITPSTDCQALKDNDLLRLDWSATSDRARSPRAGYGSIVGSLHVPRHTFISDEVRLRAAIKHDGWLKNEYPEDNEYCATGWDERARRVAQSRDTTEREMSYHIREEGAATTQDDTYRQQREMRRYHEHQQRCDNTRTIGWDAGAQHSAAASEACLQAAIHQQQLEKARTKGWDTQTQYTMEKSEAQGQFVNAARPQDEAWNSRPTDARTNVWDTPAQRAAEEAAAWERAMGGLEHVACQRREALQHKARQPRPEDSRMNGQEPQGAPAKAEAQECSAKRLDNVPCQRREALQSDERQQRHEGAVVEDSEALVLRALTEEEDCWFTAEISCLEAEKQRPRIDEDIPCRITEERARRLTRSNTSRRALRAPTIPNEIIGDSMGRNRSRVRDLVKQGFSKIPDQRIAWRNNIPYERRRPTVSQPMDTLAGDVSKDLDAGKREQLYSQLSAEKRRHEVYSGPADTTITVPVPQDIGTSARPPKKSLVAKWHTNMMTEKSSSNARGVQQDEDKYSHDNTTYSVLGYKRGSRKENEEEAPLKRGLSASPLAANSRVREVYSRPHTNTAAAPAPQSVVLQKTANNLKQSSWLHPPIHSSERLLKKSLAAKHTNMAAKKSSLAEDRGHGFHRDDAKSSCDKMANGMFAYKHCPETAAPAIQGIGLQKTTKKQLVQLHPLLVSLLERPPKEFLAANLQRTHTEASERLLNKSLAAKHTNTAAKKSSLAEDRGHCVQRDDAKSSRDKTTNGVQRFLKKSLAAKHTNTAAKKSLLAEDMGVHQDEAKVSHESLTDYSAVEYNHCPNQSIPSQLGVPSKRLPKESSAANLKRTNPVIGVELEGARQATQSPNNGRSAGQATPTCP
ncbi:hypothetical protein C8J57DRAFT_1217504 [Mycena rebaudengoi]|nr:hypothetical protein C8J57DRAFT_1217504 [Mycena rebaudengoi]